MQSKLTLETRAIRAIAHAMARTDHWRCNGALTRVAVDTRILANRVVNAMIRGDFERVRFEAHNSDNLVVADVASIMIYGNVHA